MERQVTGTTAVSHAPTYLAWSIFNTLCCCLPLGVIAIKFSHKTDKANLNGDTTSANEHSRMARNLNIAAMVTGTIFLIIYLVYYSTMFSKQT
ncbi:hypothetical protein PHYPO_G00161790 [Pangasianodon hypophthalmus]|uniref:Uncharacterized protein n=1 Tax=Pangasianodon hypophthalmus TaxID=310915 RepID=A0A5N5K621_PANHP|nr:hypothetical protein PHYPO_G00161790 [Pangasianodon hypophthalmus]